MPCFLIWSHELTKSTKYILVYFLISEHVFMVRPDSLFIFTTFKYWSQCNSSYQKFLHYDQLLLIVGIYGHTVQNENLGENVNFWVKSQSLFAHFRTLNAIFLALFNSKIWGKFVRIIIFEWNRSHFLRILRVSEAFF